MNGNNVMQPGPGRGKIEHYGDGEDDAKANLRYSTEQTLLTAKHETRLVMERTSRPDSLVELGNNDARILQQSVQILEGLLRQLTGHSDYGPKPK